MNNLDHTASTNLQDGNCIQNVCSGENVDDLSSGDNLENSSRLCHKPGCSHLRFDSDAQFRSHILSHITLPRVLVSKLDANTAKRIRPVKVPDEKHESLKVTLKLTSQAGSDRRAFEDILASAHAKESRESSVQRSDFTSVKLLFQSDIHFLEVVRSRKILSGPGEFFCLNGTDEEVKTEFFENIITPGEVRSPPREPEAQVELDEPTASTTPEERGEKVQDTEEEENESNLRDEDDSENENEEEEEEEEEEEVEEEPNARRTLNETVPSTAPPSPTPSEVLRPHGFLAPEQLVDDDSCYQGSPPASPARMVEMNGSTSAVSGSDNDSGHSRSPAAFAGGSGTGSGGEEDSSGQQGFNWDDLVGESTPHENNEQILTNENGQTSRSPSVNVNDNVSHDIHESSVASNALENDPLLLPGNSASAEGEQENMNLLQNLASDPLQPEVDRGGETEYMSIDELGSFYCDVCNERTQSRQFLEEHQAMAGHYKCLMTPECHQVWSTASELAAHKSSAHGVGQPQTQQLQQPPQQPRPPQTSMPGAPGTPPVQQLAQQVQRLPMPQQPGYPIMPSGQYPVPVPQQQMSPQLQPQMGPQLAPQILPQTGPHIPGQMPQRRPMGYRMPMAGQPYGPGSPNQQQPGFSGSIQPRPINTLVAQQPVRGQMPNRMPPAGAMLPQNAQVQRGMAPVSMRGQKRPGPMPQGVGRGVMPPAAKQRRVEGMMPPQQDSGPGKKSDAKAVANILATRGITVTPAGSARPGAAQAGSQVRQRLNMVAPAPPQPVTTLNLNSAISIIPTTGAGNGRQQSNSGFAVPQVRTAQRQPFTTNVERPPRPPTVDLTGDGPLPPPGSTRLQMGPTYHRGRGRPSNLSRATCQICDKVFASPEMLNQHMVIHRGPGKLPYRCNLCNAQYPTQQGLQQHRQTYHKESVGMSAPLAPGEEMVIPLVDLKQPGVAARLSSLGIHHCIPLSGLGNQSTGYFSLPVVSIDGSRPSAAGNLRSLGASGVLSIGPIKLVPK